MRNSLKLLFVLLMGMAIIGSCNTKDSSAPSDNSTPIEVKTTLDHFDNVIGQVVSGEYELDNNIDDYISSWETLINNGSSLNISFDNVTIEVEDSKHFLVGVDDSEEATSKVQLVLSSGYFYERSYPGVTEDEPQGSSCTCSGCKTTGPLSVNDCQPKQNEIGWYCTDCPHGWGECTKTVTVTTGSGGVGVLH